MINYIRLVLILILISNQTTASSAASDITFKKDIYNGFEAIYNFQFQRADSIVRKVKIDNKDNAGGYLLAANYYWWLIISGENTETNRKLYQENLALALSKVGLAKTKQFTNEDLYCIISVYAYRSRLEAMNKNYIKALSNVNNCISTMKKTFGKESEFEPFNLTTGIYNFSIQQVRSKHPYLFPYTVFLPAGDKKRGIEMLNKIAFSNDNLLSTEANYFLMKIYLEEDVNYKESLKYGWKLVADYKPNLLYRYYYFKSLLLSGKMELALEQIRILTSESKANQELSKEQKLHFLNLVKKDLADFKVKTPKHIEN